MKPFLRFALFAASLCFMQCTQEEATPTIDYDQKSIELMNQLTPQIVGEWSLQRVSIKRQSHNGSQAEIGIKRDTVLQNLAILSIRQAAVPRSNPKYLRHPDFDCTIQYKDKTYPLSFSLLSNPTRIVQGIGPQAFFSVAV
ncbi:hypothetical protein F1C16_13070 [Hymenobacter sp. NBH84]|uniref:DUF5004 domain-containing protein n=1 Tax=Hymenobacter defluvii TaxID=2054411 RepID=A0ABS3TH76_9BACT|nr:MULTISPECIES: hypothetical protein [Hymenobacter]MBO3273016.1 hypothetical protein [Hymenobacter defluvii]QNE40422.1 hypothetical protein F1C16_13070 [Hymenobacter sp. NBH84]